ncbi:MAG TPA: hypothetical protein VGR37_14260 [Longimicrobiaceae bacterium]|nr:hypothetical protein [Longimicrobiaceae bacterium]
MRPLLVIACIVLVSACASTAAGTGETGVVRSTTTVSGSTGTVILESYSDRGGAAFVVPAEVDRVWAALPAVYNQLGIPMGTSVPATRTYGNTSLQLGRTLAGKPVSAWLNCGEGPFGAPLANSYRVVASIVTTLAPGANGQTQLRTMVNATATNRGVSGAPVNCGTTGALETLIAERVRQIVGS